MDTEASSLIKYPCDFPIKIMGKSQNGFTEVVLSIVKTHAPDFDDAMMKARLSKNGTYLSLTCTILATSRTQLDNLYQELHDHPMVILVF